MNKQDVIAALGFKVASGNRDAVIVAFQKAGEKGLSVDAITKLAGNQSKSGDTSRTVASLISHIRTKHNKEVVKDDNGYHLLGNKKSIGKLDMDYEPWVREKFGMMTREEERAQVEAEKQAE